MEGAGTHEGLSGAGLKQRRRRQKDRNKDTDTAVGDLDHETSTRMNSPAVSSGKWGELSFGAALSALIAVVALVGRTETVLYALRRARELLGASGATKLHARVLTLVSMATIAAWRGPVDYHRCQKQASKAVQARRARAMAHFRPS